jgi:hypothetical protein
MEMQKLKMRKHGNAKVENAETWKCENMKIRKHGNAKVENAETWKCKMYFMMSRLGHRSNDISNVIIINIT